MTVMQMTQTIEVETSESVFTKSSIEYCLLIDSIESHARDQVRSARDLS